MSEPVKPDDTIRAACASCSVGLWIEPSELRRYRSGGKPIECASCLSRRRAEERAELEAHNARAGAPPLDSTAIFGKAWEERKRFVLDSLGDVRKELEIARDSERRAVAAWHCAESHLRASARLVRASWFVLSGSLGALVGAAVIYWKAAPG